MRGQVATSILARMGYSRVTLARDGQEALDCITAGGGADAFDFILMDLHMPRKVLPAAHALCVCEPQLLCS